MAHNPLGLTCPFCGSADNDIRLPGAAEHVDVTCTSCEKTFTAFCKPANSEQHPPGPRPPLPPGPRPKGG